MIRQAVILAAGKGGSIRQGKGDLPKPLQHVAGLALIKRAILTLGRAGVDHVFVVIGFMGDRIRDALETDSDYERAGITIDFVDNPDYELDNGVSLLQVKDRVQGPFVLSMADHVYDASIAKLGVEGNLDDADLILCVDRRIDDVYDVVDATKVRTEQARIVDIGKELPDFDAIDCGVFAVTPALFECLEAERAERGDCSISDGVRRLAAKGRAKVVDVGTALWQDVDTPDARTRAQRELLRSLRKPVDGPIARLVNRRVSLAVTGLLLPTPVTPNQMSVFSSIFGFVGMWLMLQASWTTIAAAGVLLQIQSILDGCDGEIARLKFQSSRFGEWLDHIIDDVSTIGFGLAAGWTSAEMFDAPIFWWLAVAGAAGLLCYNLVMSTQLIFVHKSGSPFAFRWWFQKQDVYLKNGLAKGGFVSRVLEVFHSTGRRDVLVFAWMVLCLARLPQVITIWFFTIAWTHGGLAIIHVLAGGMSRHRSGDSSSPDTSR